VDAVDLPDRSAEIAAAFANIRTAWVSEACVALSAASDATDLDAIDSRASAPTNSGAPVILAFQAFTYGQQLISSLQYTWDEAVDRIVKLFGQSPNLSSEALLDTVDRFKTVHSMGDFQAVHYGLVKLLCDFWAPSIDYQAAYRQMVDLVVALHLTTRRESLNVSLGLEATPQFHFATTSQPIGEATTQSRLEPASFVDECIAYLTYRGLPTDDEVLSRMEHTFELMQQAGLADKWVPPQMFEILVRSTTASALSVSGLVALGAGRHLRALPFLSAASSVLPWPTTLFGLAVLNQHQGTSDKSGAQFYECIEAYSGRVSLLDPSGFLGSQADIFLGTHDSEAMFLGFSTIQAMITYARAQVRG
jgi:hypothetical protein